jgi:hypothetical protein
MNEIEPLDIVFFKGGDFVSDFIRFNSQIEIGINNWSHIGIVVSTDLLPIKNGKPGKLYLWESILSGKLCDGVYNIETNDSFFGTQIRSLKRILSVNKGNKKVNIGVGKLKNNPYKKQDGESDQDYNLRFKLLKQKLLYLYHTYNNVRFQYNCIRLFNTMYDIFDPCISKNNTERLFCSQLVALILNELEVIKVDDTAKVIPADLLSDQSETGNIIDKIIVIQKYS